MPARSAGAAPVAIDAQRLVSAVADIFKAVGIAAEDAQVVAGDLVAADLEGIASHGVMLMPMYVERIVKGSVSARSSGEVVSDRGGAIVIDAGNALGQLTARQAVRLVVARARGDRARRGGRAQRLSLRHRRALRPHDRRAQLRRHRAVEHPPVDAGARRRRGHGRQQSDCRLRCPRPASFRWKRTWR